MRKDDPTRYDWNVWIDRAFLQPDGYQVLDPQCHNSKTAVESSMRAFYRKEKKKNV